MQIHVSDTPVQTLAARLVETLNGIDAPTLALSGGSTPRVLFDLLVSDYSDAVDWGKVRVFQVDERCVPPTHADSNWAMIGNHLLRPIDGIQAFRMEAERDGADKEYEALLDRELNGAPIDIVLLGMGDDGHTASLFPGTDALNETERSVVFNTVPQLDTTRMTMTYPIINAAQNKWFLSKGGDKAEAFTQVKAGNLPAARITDAEWFIDGEMAG